MQGVTLAQLEALAARAPAHRHTAAGRLAIPVGDVFERARAYLAGCPGAVSGTAIDGMKGHDRTVYTAGRLVRGFNLNPDQAYPLFAEWNQKCDPPWSEHHLRRKLKEADKRTGPRGFLLRDDTRPRAADANNSGALADVFRNWRWDERPDGETTRKYKAGRGGAELVDELALYTGGWPRRVGAMLFAVDRTGGIVWMKSASELFAWIDSAYRVGDGKGFDWAGGSELLTKEDFLAACRQHCEAWDQVELFPHEPPLPGHYYHHPEVTPGDGKHLSELVARFSPATDLDDDLIRLLFLSMCWGGPLGKRPIFVIEAVDGKRGSGKSKLASLAASLVGGSLSISPSESLKDIHARLLSPVGLTLRVGLIDNLKSLRFSNSDLEGLVTLDVISGRQMYTGEGRRPNTLQWIITSNDPSLSKDLSQRSVIIRVQNTPKDPNWLRDTTAFIEEHRWKIIGDCVAELRAQGAPLHGHEYSRWAEWEHDVMAKAPEPERLAAEIQSRQLRVDDDDEQASDVRDAIVALLRDRCLNPATVVALIPSSVLARAVEGALGMVGKAPNRISQAVKPLPIRELRKSDRGDRRGWVWRGVEASPGATVSTVLTDTGNDDVANT